MVLVGPSWLLFAEIGVEWRVTLSSFVMWMWSVGWGCSFVEEDEEWRVDRSVTIGKGCEEFGEWTLGFVDAASWWWWRYPIAITFAIAGWIEDVERAFLFLHVIDRLIWSWFADACVYSYYLITVPVKLGTQYSKRIVYKITWENIRFFSANSMWEGVGEYIFISDT